MLGIKVVIARYVDDEPQPGIVECWFDDAHGRRWSFIEKTAIVSADHLDAHTTYPRQGLIAVQVIEVLRDDDGREVVRIDTNQPWGIESVEGETTFEVSASAVVACGPDPIQDAGP